MHFPSIITAILALGLSTITLADNSPQQILDNADISWAAETYTIYAPNLNSFLVKKEKMATLYDIEGRNVPEVIKLQNSTYTHSFETNPATLAAKLLSLDPSNIKAYKDANLSERYDVATFKDITKKHHIDTIITFDPNTFDPNTFEEIIQVVVNELNPNDIHTFKVKQIIHYNEKTGQLGVTPTAIAPLENLYDSKGNKIASIPLFWLPVKEFSEKMDLNNNDITLVKRITRTIDQKDLNIIKGNQTVGEIFGKMIEFGGKNAEKAPFYHTFSTRNIQAMTADEVRNMGNSIDTIITFDPNTFDEIIQVVHNQVDPTKISQMRVVQEWVFDQSTQTISIALLLYAPLVKRYDDAGNFLNSGPMFYRKPEE